MSVPNHILFLQFVPTMIGFSGQLEYFASGSDSTNFQINSKKIILKLLKILNYYYDKREHL